MTPIEAAKGMRVYVQCVRWETPALRSPSCDCEACTAARAFDEALAKAEAYDAAVHDMRCAVVDALMHFDPITPRGSRAMEALATAHVRVEKASGACSSSGPPTPGGP